MNDIRLSEEPYKGMWIKENVLHASFNSPHLRGHKIDGGKWGTEVGDTTWGVYEFPDIDVSDPDQFFIVEATHYVDYGGEIKPLDEDFRLHAIIKSCADGLWRRFPTYSFELDDTAIAPLKAAATNKSQIAIDFESNGSGRVSAILIDGKKFPR